MRCHNVPLGLIFSCAPWVCPQILATLFSQVSQNIHRHISESTVICIYIYIHMYFLPFSGVNHSTLPLARRQMCLLLLSIWCSLKKGYLVGVCLYGSHITQSLREDLGDSISYSFSNCSCSTFFFFLSTAFHHAHDSSREESPLPLQLAFYVLLSKLGSFLLPEAHCISFKNKHTKSYFLF